MTNAILHVSKIVGRACIVVDGVRDPGLEHALRVHGVDEIIFMPKADAKVPAVSAASIIAKTLRNDMMIALHEEYPEYDWKTNAGYGSKKHDEALKKYGKTIYHRPWKNLIDIPMRR
jgi:ribonuclease HII